MCQTFSNLAPNRETFTLSMLSVYAQLSRSIYLYKPCCTGSSQHFYPLPSLLPLLVPKKTWLLFHNALSEGVVIDDILKYARMNKELADRDEDPMRVNADMRRILQAQAAELEMLKQQVTMEACGGGQNGYACCNFEMLLARKVEG